MREERIVRVDTLRHPSQRHLVHVVLTAADGATGLGETFWAASAVEAYIHEVLAPRIVSLGKGSPPRIREECRKNIYGGTRGAGPASVETAAASAIDIAAWDLAARRENEPLAAILGEGPPRAEVSTYNTCVDPDADYVVSGAGPNRDYTASFADPRRLAEELLADGFTLMKMFPFGPGMSMEHGLEIVREAAAVPGMAVAVDLYDILGPEEGRRVAEALDGLGLAWIEDPFTPTTAGELAKLGRTLATPICSGEALAGRAAFQRLVEEDGVGLLHCDVSWAGGASGALEAASVAAENGLPVTFHDCTGPIAWATSIHLACHAPNAAHVESVRTLVRGAYREIAHGVPDVMRGRVAPQGPGHGCSLTDTYRADCRVSTTTHQSFGGNQG